MVPGPLSELSCPPARPSASLRLRRRTPTAVADALLVAAERGVAVGVLTVMRIKAE